MLALRRLVPLLWLGPAIALIGVVVLWPVVVMVQSSFQQIGGEGFVAGYNGTTNYAHLFDEPDFVSVLLRTVVWVVVVVAVTVLISLGLAQLFHQRFPGRQVARWALIIPWAASVMMTALPNSVQYPSDTSWANVKAKIQQTIGTAVTGSPSTELSQLQQIASTSAS